MKYIENNSIAILSTDDKTLLGFYACTKSHNALSLNPYFETALNPRATARVVEMVNKLRNHYILVESNLLNSKVDYWDGKMTERILHKLRAVKIGNLILGGESIEIFKTRS